MVNKIRIPRTRRARDEPELVEAKLQLLGLRVRRGGGQGIPLLGRGADERDGLGDDGSGGAISPHQVLGSADLELMVEGGAETSRVEWRGTGPTAAASSGTRWASA